MLSGFCTPGMQKPMARDAAHEHSARSRGPLELGHKALWYPEIPSEPYDLAFVPTFPATGAQPPPHPPWG
eukprot:12017544-Alexandrium_andersonii.AAC.1